MKVFLFANTDWYLYNFRRELAQALRQRGDEVVLVSPPGEYARRLQELGFRWLALPLSRRGMNPLAEAAAVGRLRRLYAREQPDLVHHFTIKAVLYGSAAARLAGLPAVVNTIPGLGYVFMPGGLGRRLLRAGVRLGYRWVLRGTQVIFENEEDLQTFRQANLLTGAQGHFIPGAGVDVTRLQPLPPPPGRMAVLMAARLLWDKGVGEYVQAARRLQAEGLDVRFLLAGRIDPGNPTSIPAAQIQAWQQEGVIEWLGWIEDIAAALAQANIVCLPSYREGLPTLLIEAAACGRAVVATDVPGCRSAVQHGISGSLVPAGDAAALAEALRTLLQDPALCARMGAAGRRLAEARFSSQRVQQAILAIYDLAMVKGTNHERQRIP